MHVKKPKSTIDYVLKSKILHPKNHLQLLEIYNIGKTKCEHKQNLLLL